MVDSFNVAFQRGRAIGLHEAGVSFTNVARYVGASRRTVLRWWRVFVQTGSVRQKEKAGRARKTTERGDRILTRLAKRHRFATARELLDYWQQQVSIWTVYRRLREVGFRRRRALKRPLLTLRHRQLREQWAMQHSHWRQPQWDRIVWTDESRFCLRVIDGRLRVWRQVGERLRDDVVIPRVQGGGGSVLVWAAIWTGGRSRLYVTQLSVTGVLYRRVLEHFVEENRDALPERWILQDDNAPPHRAPVVREFKEDEGIQSLPWPANSPDLNPIEHAWDYLGRRIRSHPQPVNVEQLTRLLGEEWDLIPQEFLDNLVLSMSNRVGAVLESRGGYTRY
jgi:transposase